jgi:hypothetical protein
MSWEVLWDDDPCTRDASDSASCLRLGGRERRRYCEADRRHRRSIAAGRVADAASYPDVGEVEDRDVELSVQTFVNR